jgi:acetyl esterase/lipase
MKASLCLPFILVALSFTSLAQQANLEDPAWIKQVAPKPLVYFLPGMDKVTVARDVVYKRAGEKELKLDAYRPSNASKDARLPAIIFIHGGFLPPNLRTEPKDWNIFVSYGRLAAASGFVGIPFNYRLYDSWMSLENSASDVTDLIAYVRSNADSMGVDKERIALWAFSGGGPMLSVAIRDPQPYIRCIVSYYSLLDLLQSEKESRGTMTDQALLEYSPLQLLENSTKPMAPMLIARMGKDHPNIRRSADEFIPAALRKNVELTVINDPEGEHGFDIEDNSDASRHVIRQTIEFLKEQLGGK